jgi:hypothetical protein
VSQDLEALKRSLSRELAELSAGLTLGGILETREVLNCGLQLEGWLSRAEVLGGAWQAELAVRARMIGERIRSGHSLENGLERLMRLMILASENLEGAGDDESFLANGWGEMVPNA